MTNTYAFQVIFKRNQDSQNERGLAIGNTGDIHIIIDSEFKPVPAPVWNYTALQFEGCLPIDLK